MNTVLAEQLKRESLVLTEKLEKFLRTVPETPVLAVDLDVIEAKYRELRGWVSTHPFIGTQARPPKQPPTKEVQCAL